MSDVIQNENTNEASKEDLCKDALEHYDRVSTAYGEWLSVIPQAIKAYFGFTEEEHDSQ
ncbi:MAG: hypothetical protein MJA83_10330 [Gammaproteobacteria bacterium]|nr:hypothetical protein [Gammaproteobacteria bacterium]